MHTKIIKIIIIIKLLLYHSNENNCDWIDYNDYQGLIDYYELADWQ